MNDSGEAVRVDTDPPSLGRLRPATAAAAVDCAVTVVPSPNETYGDAVSPSLVGTRAERTAPAGWYGIVE